MNNWSGVGGRFHIASTAAHCCPGCSTDTDVAIEAAPADSGIHPVDFLDIEIAAGFPVRHLLGQRHTACMFPVDRVCPHCHVPCRVLYHDVGVRRGVGGTLVVDVASTAEGWGAVLAITAWGPMGARACSSPYSCVGDSTFTAAALASV